MKAKILDITANHPSLVNGLAAKLMENFPDKPVLTYDDYLQVEDLYLKGGMGKNGSKIIDKAQKYRHFVERLIFTDEKARFMIFHERTKEIVECGLITHDKDYHIILKVPLFQKYLHAAFYPNIGSEIDYIQENIHAKVYLDETGCLNLDKVIEKYKTYVQQRGFLPFREQDKKGNDLSIPEAVMIYSFQTFIHALLGVVGGKSYLEANKALDKTYLIIHTRGHEQVVAAKIYQHYTQFGDSKIQLAHFAQRQGLKTGYFLVFVSSNVTLTAVIEADEIIEGIQIKTYLICYDSNKDFT